MTPLYSQNSHSNSKEAYELMTQEKAIIIDVREENEITEGMIKGAKWFALSKINQDQNWLKEFKAITGDKKIYLYCRSGGRSGRVQSLLKEKGISAENLGGYMTLQNELPTLKK